MKPALEHLPLDTGESFAVRNFDYEYYPTPWHYHPEYELVLVIESTGQRFIGDNVREFGPGDLAFIGPNLPHLYRNDARYYAGRSELRARSIVVHFLGSAFGDSLFSLPESKIIRSLLDRSVRGLDFTGRTNASAAVLMKELVRLKGFDRVLCLLQVLHLLAMADERECRAISGQMITGQNDTESERLHKVFEFVMNNFHREIRMAEAAALVCMAENSFSRYFSRRTRKPFSQFVTEYRLNHASRLLTEEQVSISDICFTCGFNSISNFNKQFRKVYHMNPLNYRKLYRQQTNL
jgi:AraC-like DNA-binding protein